MTFPYHEYEVLPNPGQPQGVIYRPVVPIRVIGPAGKQTVLALVDTGSDVTVLPDFLLDLVGADGESDEQARFRGVGGQVVTARYREVGLALDHVDGLFRWTAKVGFLKGREVAILGHAGFLEYFHANFNSELHRLTLRPNKHFPTDKVE